MKFRKSREEEPNISIAPLIDIVFLLLIFFMVTSHFDIASGIRIELPEVEQKIISQEEDNRINLIIDQTGQIHIKGELVEMDSLRDMLRQMVKEKRSVHLILQADKNVPHGRVVEIMDLAKSSGVHSIIIAARWKSEELM